MSVMNTTPVNGIQTERLKEPSNGGRAGADPSEFSRVFKSSLNETMSVPMSGIRAPSQLSFSNHAIERMQRRGIQFNPEQLQKIDEAVMKAAEKGARETLVLADEAALIVSVKNRTVVTVMDKSALKDNVFTNIDSTVVI